MVPARLHQLEGFFHVARQGSYTRAAQAFPYPIGQPAVYQQVKKLQEDLGVALVRQAGPRRTELTPEGRALYEFIAPFFDGLPRLLERLAGGVSPLVLCADQLLAMEALPPALVRTQEKLPDFRLRVEEVASTEIVARVRGGQADAGLLHLPAVPRGLRWQPLGRIGVALLVPAAHALAKLDRAPTPKEISGHALIVYEPLAPGRTLAEKLFREAGMDLKVAAEVSFAQTIQALVRAGVAPAFVPYLLTGTKGHPAEEDLPKLPRVSSFEMTAPMKIGALPFGLLYRPGTEESPAFRALSEALRACWG